MRYNINVGHTETSLARLLITLQTGWLYAKPSGLVFILAPWHRVLLHRVGIFSGSKVLFKILARFSFCVPYKFIESHRSLICRFLRRGNASAIIGNWSRCFTTGRPLFCTGSPLFHLKWSVIAQVFVCFLFCLSAQRRDMTGLPHWLFLIFMLYCRQQEEWKLTLRAWLWGRVYRHP